ncbi:MAG: hypothetical protein LUQ41_09215 [Methanomicrobiales archaeon]|nr:hypothetical protein [Methanomicrobiales archaeon]
MRTRILLSLTILLTVLLLPAVVLPSGALTLDVHPSQVCPGETVSIDITGLADGSTFNYTLTSTNLVSTGLQWYNLTNFNYPFSISDGRVYIVGNNVNLIKLETKIGGLTQSIQGVGPGTVTLNFPKDITAAVYDYYRINYEVTNTAVPVTITWIHNGTKTGPEDSTTTFGITGASAGDVRCLLSVNGIVAMDEVVTIYSPCPLGPDQIDSGGGVIPTGTGVTGTPTVTPTSSVTTTPTPITVTPTPTVTGGGTAGGNGDGSGSGRGEQWRWEYQPPDILKWLGQDTTDGGQYGTQIFGEGGIFPWVVLFGIIVLVVAVIAMIYMRRKEE